jgi:hypothetical protein
MKRYKSEIFEESKQPLKEMSLMINTVDDAQNAISTCVKFIMKKKNLNAGSCMDIIGNGLISGFDSVEDLYPNFQNKEQLYAKARVIAARVSRYIMSYSKSK